MNFWGMDQFFMLNLVCFVFVLTNELAMIPVAINLACIFFLTLGSPLWNKARESTFLFKIRIILIYCLGRGWTQLGEAQGLMIPVEILLLVIQSLNFPVFIFVQFLIIWFPICIMSAYLYISSMKILFLIP